MSRILSVLLIAFVVCSAAAQNEKWEKWETEADTLSSQGRFPEAIKLYTKVIDASGLKDGAGFSALYKRAIAYYSTGDFNRALTDLDRFIQSYNTFPQARMLRGLVHKELGNTEKQLNDLAEALRTQPGNPDLLKWRASIYIDGDHFELAKQDALLARLLADDAETEMYLGIAYYNLGDTDSAFMSMDKAIELDATYLPPYLYAGTYGLDLEQFDTALKYLDLALMLDPDNSSALFYKGIALAESKKVDEGCRCLRKAFYNGMDDASDYLKEYCFGIEN
jgi:tetratricopeptide (TPR) repeat protein